MTDQLEECTVYLVRLKKELDEMEEESDFYIRNVKNLEEYCTKDVEFEIQYNNRIYHFYYSKNYPFVMPTIFFVNLETSQQVPFVLDHNDWSVSWSTRTLILSIDANMNEFS